MTTSAFSAESCFSQTIYIVDERINMFAAAAWETSSHTDLCWVTLAWHVWLHLCIIYMLCPLFFPCWMRQHCWYTYIHFRDKGFIIHVSGCWCLWCSNCATKCLTAIRELWLELLPLTKEMLGDVAIIHFDVFKCVGCMGEFLDQRLTEHHELWNLMF